MKDAFGLLLEILGFAVFFTALILFVPPFLLLRYLYRKLYGTHS
jgi:hypothetical protein